MLYRVLHDKYVFSFYTYFYFYFYYVKHLECAHLHIWDDCSALNIEWRVKSEGGYVLISCEFSRFNNLVCSCQICMSNFTEILASVFVQKRGSFWSVNIVLEDLQGEKTFFSFSKHIKRYREIMRELSNTFKC